MSLERIQIGQFLRTEDIDQSKALNEIHDDLPRGRGPDDVGRPPNAHFELPQNIVSTKSLQFDVESNRESKIFLGVIGGSISIGNRLPDGRATRWVDGGFPIGVADDRHHLLVAGSRAGKGRSVLVPNLIMLPKETSTLVIDPKGDLAKATCRWRAEGLGQDVAVIDPFECSGEGTRKYRVGFNPIEMLSRSDRFSFVPNALLIASSLIPDSQRSKDPHWNDCARDILSGLCTHVATHVRYEGRRNLVTVWELAFRLAEPAEEDPNSYTLEIEMMDNDAGGGTVRASARAFYDRTGQEFFGVLSNLRKHLAFIGIECVQDVLTGPSVDPRRLKSGSLSIYSSIPAMRGETMSGYQRMIVQLSIAACEEEKQSVGNQTVFFLEEFAALQRLECIEVAIAQLAGLGVKLLIVVQDLNQLKDKYPGSWETFIANCGVMQVFGGNDQTTLSYASKRMGDSLTAKSSSTATTFSQVANDAQSGKNWSIDSTPLMTPAEVGMFFARDDAKLRQLILRPGFHPMILQQAFYDKAAFLQGRYDPF